VTGGQPPRIALYELDDVSAFTLLDLPKTRD
jgi:hypothetical protein